MSGFRSRATKSRNVSLVYGSELRNPRSSSDMLRDDETGACPKSVDSNPACLTHRLDVRRDLW